MSDLKKMLSIEETEEGVAVRATGTGEELMFLLSVLMADVANKVGIPLGIFGVAIIEGAKMVERGLKKDGVTAIDMSALARFVEKRGGADNGKT